MKSYRIFITIITSLLFSLYLFAEDLTLTSKDFKNASSSNQSIVSAELSEPGKEKLSRLDKGKILEIKIANELATVELKEKIEDKFQFGPFKGKTARKIVDAINK